jgi:hypothetical protein
MSRVLTSPDFYSNKLRDVINESVKLKTKNDINSIDKIISISLVGQYFDNSHEIDKHIYNTFLKHVNEIASTVLDNQILFGSFVYGICISVLNGLMDSDYYSRYIYKRATDLFFDYINENEIKILTTNEYNIFKSKFDTYFVQNLDPNKINVETLKMDENRFNMHKIIYMNALSNTFSKYKTEYLFKINFLFNIVRLYENEIFKNTVGADL